jgi:hypothetical protein
MQSLCSSLIRHYADTSFMYYGASEVDALTFTQYWNLSMGCSTIAYLPEALWAHASASCDIPLIEIQSMS